MNPVPWYGVKGLGANVFLGRTRESEKSKG